MATLSNLNPTSDEITTIASTLSANFTNTSPKPHAFIKSQLISIKTHIASSIDSITESLYVDFHRSKSETEISEVGPVISELNYFINNLESLLSDEKPKFSIIPTYTTSLKVEKIALGVVLIIVPFNYPLLLAISPLIGALAAGNNVCLKLPYDNCPAFCETLTKTLLAAVDPTCLKIVNGGIEENVALLNQKWDKILFTGSTNVGKIVLSSCSENLTPVVLELGGKSPTFITANASNLNKSLKRILWGKFNNAGQTCTAPDYILLHSSIYDDALAKLSKLMNEMFPGGANKDSDYTHIINKRSFDRLTTSLSETKGEIFYGGSSDSSSNFIEPTIVTNVEFTDPLMKQEIFGPILPIIKYDDLSEAIKTVKSQFDTPLAIYIFSDSTSEINKIKTIRSGAVSINETLLHSAIHSVPFGGIGQSGNGSYHGKYSIEAFTHKRTVLDQPFWNEFLLKGRYAPYNIKKIRANVNLFKLDVSLPVLDFKGLFWWSLTYGLLFAVGIGVGIGIEKSK